MDRITRTGLADLMTGADGPSITDCTTDGVLEVMVTTDEPHPVNRRDLYVARFTLVR